MNLKYKFSIIALIGLQIILISSSQAFCLFITTNQSIHQSSAKIADHTIANMVRLDQIPESVIIQAKNTLHIAYGHTSHGSQITSGMTGLSAFKESQGGTDGLYDWNNGGTDGALDLHDYFMSGDLGNPDRITWANNTRTYLDDSANADVNVIMQLVFSNRGIGCGGGESEKLTILPSSFLSFSFFRNDFNFLIEVFFKPYIKTILKQDPEDLHYRDILSEVIKEDDSLWNQLSVEDFSIVHNSIVRNHLENRND